MLQIYVQKSLTNYSNSSGFQSKNCSPFAPRFAKGSTWFHATMVLICARTENLFGFCIKISTFAGGKLCICLCVCVHMHACA
jgi:hypothetical protein